jgi:hypothetical protein
MRKDSSWAHQAEAFITRASREPPKRKRERERKRAEREREQRERERERQTERRCDFINGNLGRSSNCKAKDNRARSVNFVYIPWHQKTQSNLSFSSNPTRERQRERKRERERV